MPTLSSKWRLRHVGLLAGVVAGLSGCGGEPSQREILNARAFEALLTAVSLQHEKEVESDARLIEDRHATGDLSDEKYRELRKIIDMARGKDWAGALERAYDFRAPFGDAGAFFN